MNTPVGTAAFTLHIWVAGRVPLVPPPPGGIVTVLTALSTDCLVRALGTLLGVPDGGRSRCPGYPRSTRSWGSGPASPALAARHYLGLVTLPTLGVYLEEASSSRRTARTLGRPARRRGHGTAPAVAGALVGLVEWVFDERELDVDYYRELPRLVLTTPSTWYLERALEDPWPLILEYLPTDAAIVSLLLLSILLYYLCAEGAWVSFTPGRSQSWTPCGTCWKSRSSRRSRGSSPRYA